MFKHCTWQRWLTRQVLWTWVTNSTVEMDITVDMGRLGLQGQVAIEFDLSWHVKIASYFQEI